MLEMIQKQMLEKFNKPSKKEAEISPSYEDSAEVKR
jgi:hypothetical protein